MGADGKVLSPVAYPTPWQGAAPLRHRREDEMTMRLLTTISVIAGLLMIATIACDSAPSGPAPTETPPDQTGAPTPDAQPEDPNVVREPAPIESVRIVVKNSLEYSLLIESGLPDSCAKFESYELDRDGSRIEVTVTNLSPTGPFSCLAVYEIHEGELPLGSDFTPGEEYTVVVNGQVTETFTAQ